MKDYELGKIYIINPFGTNKKWDSKKQKWIEYNGDEAEFMGWVKLEGRNKLPVFKFDFYSYGDATCFAVLENGKMVAHGSDIEIMMRNFLSKISFEGNGYKNIKIGRLEISKEEFITQARDTSMSDEEIQNFIKLGRYDQIYGKWGEIKYCPTCKVLRDTTCSACGCGNCKKCEYRWRCMPLNLPSFIFQPSNIYS